MKRIGNCRVLAEIGSGGMAVVYKAMQEPLGRVVAIKLLKATIAADSHFAKRFSREARFMAALQHENILHVYDLLTENDKTAIVLEYVEGIDLFDLLERRAMIAPDVAAIIALQVARALDYAHFRGVIHRDIKPANIMISRQGQVKLMDFGIAHDEALSDITDTGTGLGTPSYMSPEQILGDKLDFRSDMFSLGIVLYQMVTGAKPFIEEDGRPVMQRIRLERAQPVRKANVAVPRALEQIIQRCMEKMPSNRYPTTQALIEALTGFINARVRMQINARLVIYMRELGVLDAKAADEMLSSSSTLRAQRAVRWQRRRKQLTWLASATALLLIGGLGYLALLRHPLGKSMQSAALSSATAQLSYLQVGAYPWAKVFIDGREVDTTPVALPIPLPPGRHAVEFRHPELATVKRTVHLRARENSTLFVDLAP